MDLPTECLCCASPKQSWRDHRGCSQCQTDVAPGCQWWRLVKLRKGGQLGRALGRLCQALKLRPVTAKSTLGISKASVKQRCQLLSIKSTKMSRVRKTPSREICAVLMRSSTWPSSALFWLKTHSAHSLLLVDSNLDATTRTN